jgi:Mn2+/Fe2+ NRAMP family transporter
VLFAIVLLSASIIGAQAVTLTTSYALGDAFGMRHSLNRSFREAKLFYVAFSGLTLLAAGIVLVPGAPLGVVTVGVQALAGVLLPSVTVFLVMLCNDAHVLGPWVNKTWLNVLASIIVGVLFVLSGILVATTAVPSVNVLILALVLGALLAAGLAVLAARTLRSRRREEPAEPPAHVERESWTMPPLALLEKPAWSWERRLAMRLMTAYVLTTIVLLVVKAVQLGIAQ